MKRKIFMCVMMLILMVFCFNVYATAQSEISVYIDGEFLEFEQPPVIVDGSTLVPFRAIFEALGADVEWNGTLKMVKAQKGSTIVRLTIGSRSMLINAREEVLDVPAQIVGAGYTMVPVRAVAEAFDVWVDWEDETRTVVLLSKKPAILNWTGYYSYNGNEQHIDENEPVIVRNFNGEIKIVPYGNMNRELQNGWTTEHIYQLYDDCGNMIHVKSSEKDDYINDGWYDDVAEITIDMYTSKGEKQTVFIGKIDEAVDEGLLFADSEITLYSIDGAQQVAAEKIAYYVEKYGYSFEDGIKMYAPNGRTKFVVTSQIEANEKVGWSREPLVQMYSLSDGSIKYVAESQVENHKQNGWTDDEYTQVKMYRTYENEYVYACRIARYIEEGWSFEPQVVMYAKDGRSKYVAQSQVEANKKVGWYEEPFTTLYAADGRTIQVMESQVKEYRNVGWFLTPEQAENSIKTKLYAEDGRKIKVLNTEVNSYLAVGWYRTEEEAQEAKTLRMNREAVGNFRVGNRVMMNALIIIRYGTVQGINYETGEVQVYWDYVTDGNDIPINTTQASLLWGLYTSTWEGASYLRRI